MEVSPEILTVADLNKYIKEKIDNDERLNNKKSISMLGKGERGCNHNRILPFWLLI